MPRVEVMGVIRKGLSFMRWITLVLAVCVGSSMAATPMFRGLGDLPGGNFESFGGAISSDGSTVVGAGTSANGTEAFRWTWTSGMHGLGDLPGLAFSSYATDVSADGQVV